ncbi:hypothetical protein [Streptomyces sp. NBC_01238]|uniref:hypothetical protein n=1 Tax=Streptomyces sp. NBC_01238 TaxID=2903791 RepID=UPI003863D825
MTRPRTTRPARRARRSHLAGYGFATLTLLAIYTDQAWPALFCLAATALTWKGHRNR